MIALRKRAAAIAAGAALISGAAVMAAGTASATTPALRVVLKAGYGGSATWDTSGNPVLTPGTDTGHTYAEVGVPGAQNAAPPGIEPSFTTDNYAAGSPRWVIELSNGKSLWGYPPNAHLNGTGFGWAVDNGNTYTSYAAAVSAAGAGATVTSAFIVADGGQAAGTHDTLTNVQYGGQILSGADGVGPVSTFVNYSRSCLDNKNFNWTVGNPIQIWQCGAAGGADQQFRLAYYAGAQVLQAVAPPSKPAGPWCVTATLAKGDALTIQRCTGTGGQVVKKAGSFYEFPTQNLVMDLTGYRTANGTKVQGWPLTGGRNQQWSLP